MVAIFLIGIVSFIYLRVKRMTKQFRNGSANANRTNGTNRRQQQNSAAGSTKRRSAEYDDGVVVEEELYDERSPHTKPTARYLRRTRASMSTSRKKNKT